ncbi:MAG: beta-lactamase family protein [Sphingomonas sp.]|nr:beta-lactamase family protein [Sphingomonas sp.]
MVARISLAAVALIGLASVAPAQQLAVPAQQQLAIAAGYKAAMTCSGVFIGGRTEAQLAADELHGIYPEYDAIVPKLTAEIDRARGTVLVRYADQMPPRVAHWAAGTGCTTMPIGTDPRVIAVAAPPAPRGPLPAPWPLGDALPRIAHPPLTPVARAFDGISYGKGSKTTGVIVVRGRQLIAEQYAPDFGPFTAQRTWSVAKSITGTLVGIAVKQGVLKVEAPAPIAGWSDPIDPRRAITVDQLLHMSSGLYSDTAGNRTDAVYFGGTAVSDNVDEWPLEARPGTRFRYANNDILLAMMALRASLGEARYRDYPARALFAPIGMLHTTAETDWRGNYVSSSQIWTTARDLARFGLLYLDDGVWNGVRLLPEGWTRYVATPKGPQPPGEFGYGATFWLLNKSPGVPADSYGAFGNRGQYVIIVPSRQLVIVRRGEDPGAARFDIARFVADLLVALQ